MPPIPATPWPTLEATARLGDRSLFPDLGDLIYLNHAAISPPSRPVQQAVTQALTDYATQGAGAFGPSVATRQRLKARLGRLLGVPAADLALTSGTTAGVQAVALSHPWRPGDGVIVFEGEFPANVTTWQQAARHFDLRLESMSLDPYAASAGADLSPLAARLARGDVALVAVSAVQFQTGLRMPLAEMADLCHRHGAALFVDAIQAAGVVPMEAAAWGVDYLAGGGHKWLMATEGAGYLYAAPDRAAALRPLLAGWLSHDEPLGFLFEGPGHLRYDRPIRPTIDFLESSSAAALLYAALDASCALIEQLGVAEIFAHVQRCHDVLEAGLVERGFTSLRAPDEARRSGNLCLIPPEGVDPVALMPALSGAGLSCALPDGRLRLSPHWPNDLDQCQVALSRIVAAL